MGNAQQRRQRPATPRPADAGRPSTLNGCDPGAMAPAHRPWPWGPRPPLTAGKRRKPDAPRQIYGIAPWSKGVALPHIYGIAPNL